MPSPNGGTSRPVMSIILCGGRGTRMQARGRHKVCFDVGGRPAINRAIDVYESCGIERHIVVVGATGGQVVETVGPVHPHVTFAYQAEPIGTGRAAKVGARVLEALGYEGDVLVVAGDKVIEPVALERLIETFYRTRADLAVLMTTKSRWPRAGRILLRPNGEIAASIEIADVQRTRILGNLLRRAQRGSPIATSPLRRRIIEQLGSEAKAETALGPVWAALTRTDRLAPAVLRPLIDPDLAVFTIDGERLTADAFERRCDTVNLSVYLLRATALYAGLGGLNRDNAQHEEYLTDAINVLANLRAPDGTPRFKCVPVAVEDPNHVLAFNNPEDLVAVEDYLRVRGETPAEAPVLPIDRRVLRPAGRWLAAFEGFSPALRRAMRRIYGDDEALVERKRRAYLRVLKAFRRRFGAEARVVIARAPGRVNLMGRHIDHEGGHVNAMAIDREILLVAQARDDAAVHLVNATRGRRASARFSLADELAALDWETWLSRAAAQVGPREGVFTADWDRLILAALLRLQATFPRVRLAGMNAVMASEIPPAGGLSSSSATVVAAAEAAVALNRLDVAPNELIDLCGESEWYAGGPSGGSHLAAVKFGRRGSVAHMRFHEFEILETVPLPAEARVVICGTPKAAHPGQARRIFQQRRACYALGLILLKDRLPAYAAMVRYLRDITPDHLGITLRQIYRALLSVPESITGRALLRSLSAQRRAEAAEVTRGQPPTTRYPLRGVMLFGLGECERSRRAVGLLRAGDLAALGRLMRVSHDGDRVVRHTRTWRSRTVAPALHDDYLKDRILDLASEDPERVLRGQIYLQPGAYGCSTKDLDLVVDLALDVEGVYGAQMAGAGLGGCVMVVCRPAAVAPLTRRLRRDFYRARRTAPSLSECIPVEGAGVLRM